MADNYTNYTDYSTVISSAIADFDAIQAQMKAKGVVDSSDKELNSDTTGVKTSEYSGLISDQLFRVGDRKKAGLSLDGNGKIRDLGSITLTSSKATFSDKDDGTRVLSVTTTYAGNPGYIDGSSAVTIGGISADNFSVSGTLSTDGGSGYTYDETTKKYTITGNSDVIEKVVIDQGSGLVGIGNFSSTHGTKSNTISLATATDNDNINSKVVETVEDADLANYVQIALSAVANCADTVTAKLTKTFESGYINADDVAFDTTNTELAADGTVTHAFESVTHATGEKTLYLPKGSAAITGAEGAKVAFDGADAITADSGADLKDEDTFATITAKVDGLKINGEITEGWVSSGNIPATAIDVDSKSIKIKKGTLDAGSTNVHLTATPSKVDLSDDVTNYVITLTKDADATSKDAGTKSLSVTNGYLTSTAVANAEHAVTVEEKKVYITGAQVKKKIDTPTVTLDGTGSTLLASSAPVDAQYYTIDTKVSASIADNGSTNGYFDPSTDTTAFTGTGLSGAAGGTFYLKKGSVTLAHGLTISDGATASGLTTSTPSGTLGTDYYKIETSGSMTTVEGYITSNEVSDDADKAYYIPKAVVEYVTNSDNTHFVQVKTAGYLTAGTIDTIEGTLDEAEVKGTLTDTGTVLSTTGSTGDYQISIAKSIAAGAAGYISSDKGSLALDNNYYIKHGTVSYKAAIASITNNGISRVSGTDNKFYINVTAAADKTAAGTTATLSEGYVKSADITITAADDKTTNLEIEEATIGVSGSGKIGATASANVSTSTSATKYVITPTFESTSLAATITKAGYVDEDSGITGSVTVADSAKTPVYLTVGTTTTLTPTAHAKTLASSEISDNFSTSQTGAYTITINGKDSLTGTLTPGYYGADEATIAANSTIAGTYSVAHGSASITAASATFNIAAGTGLTLVESPSDTTKYYEITANGSNLSLTKSVTQGYVKDADVDAGLTTITGSKKKYIANYEYGTDASAAGTVTTTSVTVDGAKADYYTPTAAVDFGEDADYAVIHTKATYVEKDIYVNLGADAIGANAKADLEKLKQRLAGTLAKA